MHMDITNRNIISYTRIDIWVIGFEGIGATRETLVEYLGMGAHGVTTQLLKRSAQLRPIYLFHLLIYIFYHHYKDKEKYSFDFLCRNS